MTARFLLLALFHRVRPDSTEEPWRNATPAFERERRIHELRCPGLSSPPISLRTAALRLPQCLRSPPHDDGGGACGLRGHRARRAHRHDARQPRHGHRHPYLDGEGEQRLQLLQPLQHRPWPDGQPASARRQLEPAQPGAQRAQRARRRDECLQGRSHRRQCLLLQSARCGDRRRWPDQRGQPHRGHAHRRLHGQAHRRRRADRRRYARRGARGADSLVRIRADHRRRPGARRTRGESVRRGCADRHGRRHLRGRCGEGRIRRVGEHRGPGRCGNDARRW